MLLILNCFTNTRMPLSGGFRAAFSPEELLSHSVPQANRLRGSCAPIRAGPYPRISDQDEKAQQRKPAPRIRAPFLILAQRHRERSNLPEPSHDRVAPPASWAA